jgi:hypothetical protein
MSLSLVVAAFVAEVEQGLAEVAAGAGFDFSDAAVALGGAAAEFVVGQWAARVGGGLTRESDDECFDVAIAGRRSVADESLVVFGRDVDLHGGGFFVQSYHVRAVAVKIPRMNGRGTGVRNAEVQLR